MAVNPAISIAVPRGALVSIAADGSKTSIPFQYNPDTIRRTLTPNTVGGTQGARSGAVRFAGAPAEEITFTCQLTATMATAPPAGTPTPEHGVSASLAALTLLAYPTTAAVASAQAMLDAGAIEVLPPLADRLLLVWGTERVVPARLTGCTVTEQLYDTNLVPVAATVEVTLRTLTYSDVDPGNHAYHDFVVYQQGLEKQATAAERR